MQPGRQVGGPDCVRSDWPRRLYRDSRFANREATCKRRRFRSKCKQCLRWARQIRRIRLTFRFKLANWSSGFANKPARWQKWAELSLSLSCSIQISFLKGAEARQSSRRLFQAEPKSAVFVCCLSVFAASLLAQKRLLFLFSVALVAQVTFLLPEAHCVLSLSIRRIVSLCVCFPLFVVSVRFVAEEQHSSRRALKRCWTHLRAH